jgi:hypothetical protein
VACRVSQSGHMEQLPSGSWLAKAYAGKDPSRPNAVYLDPKGTRVPLAGQAYLHVVFTGVTGEPAKLAAAEPGYPQLLTVAPAGYFEGVASFGIGLASKSGTVHVFTTWAQYWSLQYTWLNGHQPWLASPLLVVRAWAGSGAKITQLSANAFRVMKTSRVYTVTGRVPVPVPGPWVMTTAVPVPIGP